MSVTSPPTPLPMIMEEGLLFVLCQGVDFLPFLAFDSWF